MVEKGKQATTSEKPRSTTVKNQLRGLKRLLKKPGLEEAAKKDIEEKIKVLSEKVQDKLKEEKERHLRDRYKLVRFLESRKVTRKIDGIEAKLARLGAGDDKQRASLEQSLAKLKDDLLYITHFPNDRKYVALFPHQDAKPEHTERLRAEIRAAIKQKLAETPNAYAEARAAADRASTPPPTAALEQEDDFFLAPEDSESKPTKSSGMEVDEEPGQKKEKKEKKEKTEKKEKKQKREEEHEAPAAAPAPSSGKSERKRKGDTAGAAAAPAEQVAEDDESAEEKPGKRVHKSRAGRRREKA